MKEALRHFKLAGLLLVALCSAAPVDAQEADPRAIIERSLKAIGGREELARVRSIYAFADCTGPGGKYSTELYSATGLRLVFKQVKQGGATFIGYTNGEEYWTKDKMGEVSLEDKNAAFSWRSHEFQWLAFGLLERFRDPSFAGEEEFNGRRAFKLRLTDELGQPAHFFFDKESGLMLGFTVLNPFERRRPETIRIVFNEWKQVGKIKLPSKVTATDKQEDYVLSFKEIALNRLDEKIFSVPVQVAAIKELLELHNQARAAHFKRDAKLLVSSFADDFTDIRDGKVQKPQREASISRLQAYFNRSTFLEWDDIKPPVIRVSEDATMAYVVVQKKVKLLTKDEKGAEYEEVEVFAWVALYRKIGGKWMLTLVASTRTPEDEVVRAEDFNTIFGPRPD
jgi:hypothetical protein